MNSMMKMTIAFSILLAFIPLPALAQSVPANIPGFNFSGPQIPNLLPDMCIPTGLSTYCITFTNSGTQALSGLLNANIQQGQMQAQQLQQAPLGSIASLATQAGINAQIQQLLGSGNPAQIANAIAQAIMANHAQAVSDQATLNTTMQQNGTGQLAATQIQAAILQNLTAKMEQLNALQAAQQTQNQTEVGNAYQNAGTELDLTGPVTSGWLI
jgi:hypothetical protein